MCSTSEKGCFILIPLGGCSSGQRRGAPRSPRRPRGAPGAIFGPKNACRASARARERAERSSHWDKSILLKILQRSVLGAAPPAAPPAVDGPRTCRRRKRAKTRNARKTYVGEPTGPRLQRQEQPTIPFASPANSTQVSYGGCSVPWARRRASGARETGTQCIKQSFW